MVFCKMLHLFQGSETLETELPVSYCIASLICFLLILCKAFALFRVI